MSTDYLDEEEAAEAEAKKAGRAGGETDKDFEAAERLETMNRFQAERGELLDKDMKIEVVSDGLDVVPFLGGTKMMIEALAGRTLAGDKLADKEGNHGGTRRIIHAMVGAGSLALDFVPVAGEVKDGTVFVGRSVGLVEKLGTKFAEKGAFKSAKVFETSAAFMAKHPEATKKAEQAAGAKLKGKADEIETYKQKGAKT
jgi:hypothetical protein